jgi:hypothetical protein
MPINPPYVCQGRTDHPAQLFRMSLAGSVTGSNTPGSATAVGGVNPYLGNQLKVTGLASMNVAIDTGLAYVPSSTAWNGMYGCYNTTSFNVSIAASSSTQWRRDYIVAQVTDPGDNTANWNVVAVTGTFSSTAPGSLPALPNNCIPLAIVNVVPNMTVTSGAGTISDARVLQPLAGVQTTTSAAKPATTSREGTLWVETDTHRLGVILNGAQNYLVSNPTADGTWTSLTPQNGWAGSIEYRFVAALNAVWVIATLDPSSETNAQFQSLPVGFRPATQQDSDLTFHTGTGASSGAFLRVQTNGSMQVINVATNLGVMVVNSLVSLDA